MTSEDEVNVATQAARDDQIDARYREEMHKKWHAPRLYRYRVADRAWFLPVLNRYPHHVIGAGVVVGSYAYCVKWADL